MSKPTDVRFELHDVDPRARRLTLVLFAGTLVAVVLYYTR